jgi:hypothetical protein
LSCRFAMAAAVNNRMFAINRPNWHRYCSITPQKTVSTVEMDAEDRARVARIEDFIRQAGNLNQILKGDGP